MTVDAVLLYFVTATRSVVKYNYLCFYTGRRIANEKKKKQKRTHSKQEAKERNDKMIF